MPGPIVPKAEERDICIVCGWEKNGWELCGTVDEALKRECVRYNPSTQKPVSGLEGVVVSSTPHSPSDFH